MSDGLVMMYFVLKPRGNSPYARASRRAMFAYAHAIMEENPVLSRQLWDWAGDEKIAADFPDEADPPKHWEPPKGDGR